MKRETKKQTTIILKPSIKKKAMAKAEKEGYSFSQIIENLLLKYVAIVLLILFLTSCATQNGCQQNRNFIGYHSK